MIRRLKAWATEIRRDILALYLAARDPRVPWYAKTLAAVVAAYALSPIDLIPDFIPVIGYLDDLLLLPLGIVLVVKMIPEAVMADLRQQAETRIQTRPESRMGAVGVVLVWITMLAFGVWLLWKE